MSDTYLIALYLHQFRPFEEAYFEFVPGINLIAGPNARGKTSILEAIYFLMNGFSFRTSRIPEMIRKGHPYFQLEVGYCKHGVRHRLNLACSEKERRVNDNHNLSFSLNTLPGILPGVVMTPEDISIINGSPQSRRDYLDAQIAQTDPLYTHHLNRYQRAMRQRNALLKHRQTATIESWEHEMAHAASYIITSRSEAIAELAPLSKQLHMGFASGNEELILNYQTLDCEVSSVQAIRKHLLEQYEKLRKRELDLGITLIGPHKDDMSITLNGLDARNYASEGQQRTCVASLRCAEWERIQRQADTKPLMLIDDIGMGMDKNRQGKLADYLDTLGQVFLTGTSGIAGAGLPPSKILTIDL